MRGFATRLLVLAATLAFSAANTRAADTAPTASKVYAIVTVYIDPAEYDLYLDLVRNLLPSLARQGIELVGSYSIQFGESAREIDIWSGPDAETIRRAFFAKGLSGPDVYRAVKREVIEIADRNPIAPIKGK
jgi:hypothetical protein